MTKTALTMPTVALAEAKNNLSAWTARANDTGQPFTITKNGKPWVEVYPVAHGGTSAQGHISPSRKVIRPADIGTLFEDRTDDFEPREDGFSRPVGEEAL